MNFKTCSNISFESVAMYVFNFNVSTLVKTLWINDLPEILIRGFFGSLVEPILDGIRINVLVLIFTLKIAALNQVLI